MSAAGIENGDLCVVIAGTHKGNSGIVQDKKVSATGHFTITVEQDDGIRLKTLAKKVTVQAG